MPVSWYPGHPLPACEFTAVCCDASKAALIGAGLILHDAGLVSAKLQCLGFRVEQV